MPNQLHSGSDILHPVALNPTHGQINATSAINLFLHIVLHILLRLLLAAFAVLQAVSLATHGRLCQLFALSPCQVHGPRQSAIVIVGGDDDLGRHIAFNFSELGYTVFALCPDRQPAIQSATDASNVSSVREIRTYSHPLFQAPLNASRPQLIQEWHQRIKKSGHSTSPWGLLAPIVLDMTSGAQRTRAFETVDAYCATHSLHLVAVIVLPAPVFIMSEPDRTGLSISAWGDIVRECLVEPISVVQDYVSLLSAASGRVVLLLASGHQPWIPSLHKGVLRSVAQYLRQELDALGIKISTVVVGPSAPVSKSLELDRSHTGVTSMFHSQERGGISGYIPSIRNTIEKVLPHFAVHHEDIWRVMQRVVRSRYPGKQYTIGLHATLQDVCESMPTMLHLCLQSITPYFS